MNHNIWITETDTWETEPDCWDTEEPFDLELVRQGVSTDKRCHTLHQYLGWLIKQGYLKAKAKAELTAWNQRNHPPLPSGELNNEIERCWAMWAKSQTKKV